MYENVSPAYYSNMQVDDPTHAGSEGWSHAPVPGWGVNPVRVGPPTLGDTAALVDALQQAAKKVTWTTVPPAAPFVPYPVHRQVPSVMFNEVTAQSSAPWGRFPQQRAYDGLGAYFAEAPLRAVSGLGAYFAEAPLRAVNGLGVEAAPVVQVSSSQLPAAAAAGTAVAVSGILIAAAIGIPLVLAGTGYWFGGKIAPSPAQKRPYQWGSAAANVFFPVLGPLVLAVVATASGSNGVQANPRKKSSKKRRATRRRAR